MSSEKISFLQRYILNLVRCYLYLTFFLWCKPWTLVHRTGACHWKKLHRNLNELVGSLIAVCSRSLGFWQKIFCFNCRKCSLFSETIGPSALFLFSRYFCLNSRFHNAVCTFPDRCCTLLLILHINPETARDLIRARSWIFAMKLRKKNLPNFFFWRDRRMGNSQSLSLLFRLVCCFSQIFFYLSQINDYSTFCIVKVVYIYCKIERIVNDNWIFQIQNCFALKNTAFFNIHCGWIENWCIVVVIPLVNSMVYFLRYLQ